MGLSCSKEISEKFGFSEQMKETNKKIYLCNAEGEEMSSSSMRGIPDTTPVLSPETQAIVVESWKIIRTDIERVGVVMFMG